MGNLPVQQIVFRQQDASAPKIVADRSLLIIGRTLFLLQFPEEIADLRAVERFRQESRHSRRSGLFLYLGPVVCRQNDDRHFISRCLSNAPRDLHSIHIRHLPVDDHQLKRVLTFHGLSRKTDRRDSLCRKFRTHPDILKKLRDTFAGLHVNGAAASR